MHHLYSLNIKLKYLQQCNVWSCIRPWITMHLSATLSCMHGWTHFIPILWVKGNVTMCRFTKYPYSPHRVDWNFLGVGCCETKKYRDVPVCSLVEFSEGWVLGRYGYFLEPHNNRQCHQHLRSSQTFNTLSHDRGH